MPIFPIALALALAAGDDSSACDSEARAPVLPAAALSRELSVRYPNGADANLTIAVDASGKVTSVTVDADAPLRGALAAWTKTIPFVPARKNCHPVASTVEMNGVDFYPAASGVLGTSKIVQGVDFANMTYADGPGNCKTSHMHAGIAQSETSEWDATIQDAFAGRVAGRPVVVVILRCEYNGHGFDSQAQLFAIARGKALRLGILGNGGMMSSDSPFPPWPGGWIHLGFLDDKLYADVWDHDRRCDPHRDWVSSTYTIRDGKLVTLDTLRHHRAGIPPACQ